MIGYIQKALSKIDEGECYPSMGWELVPLLRDKWLEAHEGAHSTLEYRGRKGVHYHWERHPWRPSGMSRKKALDGWDDTGYALIMGFTSPEGMIGVYIRGMSPKHHPKLMFDSDAWNWNCFVDPEEIAQLKEQAARDGVRIFSPLLKREDSCARFSRLELDLEPRPALQLSPPAPSLRFSSLEI